LIRLKIKTFPPIFHWANYTLNKTLQLPFPNFLLSPYFSIFPLNKTPLIFTSLYFYGAVLPRRRPHHVLILSLCLSVCPMPPPRGKTKRPTNTKLGRKGPWDTSTPWTNFKAKGSGVKVTAAVIHRSHPYGFWLVSQKAK